MTGRPGDLNLAFELALGGVDYVVEGVVFLLFGHAVVPEGVVVAVGRQVRPVRRAVRGIGLQGFAGLEGLGGRWLRGQTKRLGDACAYG